LGLANLALVNPRENARITGATRNSSIMDTAGKTNKKPALADLASRLLLKSFPLERFRVAINYSFGKGLGGVVNHTPKT
jgi:hypothetical protein